jgi:hypothetical protein
VSIRKMRSREAAGAALRGLATGAGTGMGAEFDSESFFFAGNFSSLSAGRFCCSVVEGFRGKSGLK